MVASAFNDDFASTSAETAGVGASRHTRGKFLQRLSFREHDAGSCVTTIFSAKQRAALVTAKGVSFTYVAGKVHDSIVHARNACEHKGFDRKMCELRTVVCGDNR